jgi:gluconokinase
LQIYRGDARLKKQPILAVGTSAFWHSMIGVGDKNKPLTPIYTWADSRCRPDAKKLREEFSEKAIHRHTGCMLRASFWPAKLAWLRRVQPKLNVRIWMSPAEWLYREFFGVANCSYSMASGTGLFLPGKLQWDSSLLERFDLDESRLNIPGDEPMAGCRLFDELKSVPWFPAIGDGACGNLGSGASCAGLAAINVGTSSALRVMKSGGAVRAPFGLFCYRVDAGRFVVGGAASNAGNLRAWCLRELKLTDNSAVLEREMAARPSPAHGLTVLPFWTAERAPTWDDEKTGMIHGITQNTTALDILQATTEASYYRIARIADLILEKETTAPKFIVSGGIQRSPSSLQRLADILNQPVYPNEEAEASLRGAAIFAIEKAGLKPGNLKLGKPIRPRKRFTALYGQAKIAQQSLEDCA